MTLKELHETIKALEGRAPMFGFNQTTPSPFENLFFGGRSWLNMDTHKPLFNNNQTNPSKMEKTLKLDESSAKKLYPGAAPEFKELLEKNFGKKTFITDITERIKTIDDILEYHGKSRYQFNLEMTGRSKRAIAYELLEMGVAAMNEGWIPNWKDRSEAKHYPLFNMDGPTGFGFSDTHCDCTYTYTNVGSRLVFKNSKHVSYFATQFLSIYRDYMTY